MTLLKYNQTIRRKKGKKVYDSSTIPHLPEDWQNKPSELTIETVKDGNVNYLIRPDEDIVVIDVDTKKHTKKLLKMVKKEDYVVKSDNGTAHLYYKVPKNFFTKNRIRLENAIDILIGKSLVFTPNKYNKTKKVKQGSIANITKMPKKILSYLESMLPDSSDEAVKTSNNILHYMLKDELEEKMELYKATKDFKYLYNIFSILTPAKYRQYVEPDLHPDNIPDGMGIFYLQALSSKLAGDISVSPELHKDFITLIARELWSNPLPKSRLRAFLSNLTKQRYPDGSPVFIYDKNATKNVILISENKSPLYPLYRTIEDTYLIIRENKVVEIPSFTALKRLIMSQNIKAMINGKQLRDFKVDNLASIRTIQVEQDKTLPTGLGLKEFSYVYNTIDNPPEFEMLAFNKPDVAVIRIKRVATASNAFRESKEKILDIDWSDMPTIRDLLYNITYDHAEEQQIIITKLLLFLSKKLTTLEYSPIVLQLLGSFGTGKSKFTELLDYITAGVKEVVFESGFNAEYKNALFLYEDEGTMSPKVINRIKQLSGNSIMRIEAKGVNATYERNLATIIVNSNKYKTMAQNMSDRRFVSLCSFNAPRLEISNIEVRLRKEIKYFAELLLEIYHLDNKAIKDLQNKLYFDAVYWQDSTTVNLYKDKVAGKLNDEAEGKEATLAYIFDNHKEFDDETLLNMLERALGYGFKFYVSKGEVRVPFNSRNTIRYKGDDLPNNPLSPSMLIKYNIRTGRAKLEIGNVCQYITMPKEVVCRVKEAIFLQSRCLRGCKNFNCIKDLS